MHTRTHCWGLSMFLLLLFALVPRFPAFLPPFLPGACSVMLYSPHCVVTHQPGGAARVPDHQGGLCKYHEVGCLQMFLVFFSFFALFFFWWRLGTLAKHCHLIFFVIVSNLFVRYRFLGFLKEFLTLCHKILILHSVRLSESRFRTPRLRQRIFITVEEVS